MKSIHGSTEKGDTASTSSELQAKRFKVDTHIQRDPVNNCEAKILLHTLPGRTPANSPTSSPLQRNLGMTTAEQPSGGNESYRSQVIAANSSYQTHSAKEAQTTPLAFPTLPVNLQPNRGAAVIQQPPVLANREQPQESSVDEIPTTG